MCALFIFLACVYSSPSHPLILIFFLLLFLPDIP